MGLLPHKVELLTYSPSNSTAAAAAPSRTYSHLQPRNLTHPLANLTLPIHAAAAAAMVVTPTPTVTHAREFQHVEPRPDQSRHYDGISTETILALAVIGGLALCAGLLACWCKRRGGRKR